MVLIDHPHIDRLIIPSTIKGDKKYYLYVHYRQDKHEPFYVGIATKYRTKDYDRALCYKKRNPIWKRICNKTRYNVMIISETDDKQEIINQEINYIKILGKKKDKLGTLSNITDGGEGLVGCKTIWSEESKDKIRRANSTRVIKESTREKLRQNLYKKIEGGIFARKGKDNYGARSVLKVDKLTNIYLQKYDTIKEAADEMKVTHQSIGNALKKGNISCGYKWIYTDGNN